MTTQKPSYEDYVRRIPTSRRVELEKKLDYYQQSGVEKHLYEIAAVLLEWRDLIPHLELDNIVESDVLHEHSPSQQRIKFLQNWKSRFGFKATYGWLLKACSDGRSQRAAEKIVTLLGGTNTADDHDKNVNQAGHDLNRPQGIESQPQAPPPKRIMAKSEEYKRLKKCRGDVEKLIMPELAWIADELSDEDVAFLNDAQCNEVKNPAAMKTPEQKAAMVFALVLNRVDVDPDALGEFVSILRKKPKTFKTVINKLNPTGSGTGDVPISAPVVPPSTSVRQQRIEEDSALEEDSSPVVHLSTSLRQRLIEDSAQGQKKQDLDEMETDFAPAVAKSEEYERLSKYRSDVEKLMKPELDWIADELKKVTFLTAVQCSEVKSPASTKTPSQKAAMVFSLVLDRVDADSDALGEFVRILWKKPKAFKLLFKKLDPAHKWTTKSLHLWQLVGVFMVVIGVLAVVIVPQILPPSPEEPQKATQDTFKNHTDESTLMQQLYDKLYEHISPDGTQSFYIHKTSLMWDWQPDPLGVNYAEHQMVSIMPSYVEEGKDPFYSSSGDAIYDAYTNTLTSVKLTASVELPQQYQEIDDQLSVLLTKWTSNRRKFAELYEEEKGGDPNFTPKTEWMKENHYFDVLHSDDEEIKRLTQKKANIALASGFKENEAYNSLNNTAGFVNTMDPNKSTKEKVPNFKVGQNAIQWRNKVANHKGNAVKIELSSSSKYKSTSKFRFGSGLGIFSSSGGGGGKESLNLEKGETTINIEFEALDTINVTPDDQWYKSAYLKRKHEWLMNQTPEEVFGPQGFHSIITGLVVCYHPSITITTSTSNLKEIKTVVSGKSPFSIGPFSFGSSGSYENYTYDFKHSKASVTIKSKSDYGRILGVMVKNPYYG